MGIIFEVLVPGDFSKNIKYSIKATACFHLGMEGERKQDLGISSQQKRSHVIIQSHVTPEQGVGTRRPRQRTSGRADALKAEPVR